LVDADESSLKINFLKSSGAEDVPDKGSRVQGG